MIKKLLLLSCAASSLLATNGVNMIGTGTVSRSMGGTGVAHFSDGSGALAKNVALIADVKGSELHLDVTYFNASVSTATTDWMFLNTTPANGLYHKNPGYVDSENHLDTNFIPTMSYVDKLNDKWSWGLTMMGAAGMGVDYKDAGGNDSTGYAQRRLKSGMMLMKIIPGFSYRTGNTTFGFAPVLGLGSMSINYDDAQTKCDANGKNCSRDPRQSVHGDGSGTGLFGTNIGGPNLVPAIGWQVGMDVKVTEKLRVGATYQSSLVYKYKEVANFNQFGPYGMVNMMNDFAYTKNGTGLKAATNVGQAIDQLFPPDGSGQTGTNKFLKSILPAVVLNDTVDNALSKTDPKNLNDLTMEQPWEIAIGADYQLTDQVSITGDYRYIAWGLAEGYKDFGWENQSVFALGFEFRPTKEFRFRGGYNYADSPIKNKTGEIGSLLTDIQGTYVFDQAVSMLNMTGFPAIATTHFTLGAGYDITKNFTLDGAFMYSPESEVTRSGSLIPGASDLAGNVTGLPPGVTLDFVDMNYEYKTKMQQMTLSLGMNYKF